VTTTGDRSELARTIPITRRSGGSPRVVMSLGPRKLPRLRRADQLKLNAEVQATTTCVTRSVRCVGRQYGFSPTVVARLVLADRGRAVGGRHAVTISARQSVRCHQPRPNRNHHCVLVFRNVVERLGPSRRLPCRLRSCHVNLVLDASSPRARGGEVLIIGADRPDGSIQQDMGRLNAIVIPRRSHPHTERLLTTRRIHRSLTEGAPRSGGWRVVYSLKLAGLERGDVLAAAARARTGIGALPYSAFVTAELITAGSRRSTHPFRRDVSLDGFVTEANGFNCTQGPSAYETPCLTRKAGVTRIRRHPVDRHGRARPLYLNLIMRSFPKLARAGPGDAAQVLRGGFLAAVLYPGPGR
jgi:hypothetical protein